MNRIIFIACFTLFMTTHFHGQDKFITISPTLFDQQQRIQLGNIDGWLFHEGNNENWALTEIDLTTWTPLRPAQLTTDLNSEDGRTEGWFRLKFNLNHAFDSIPLSIDRDLWIAMDVYLDGELIHSYGSIGTDKIGFQYFNPNHKLPLPLELQVDRNYILAIHITNYEDAFTPRDLKLKEENLLNIINLTGPDYTHLEEHFQKSSFIHSTFWVTLSTIFMILFWLMYLQNPKEKVFRLIAYLSVANFLTILGTSAPNFFELSFTQEKIRNILSVATGSITNVFMLMVGEWIFKQRISTLSKFLLVSLPIAGIFASIFDLSAPFGLLNAILTVYFVVLIISHWKKATKVQWAVVVAMFLFLVSISVYIVLAKFSMNFILLYGNLWLSVALFIPLISLLIYVSLRFSEIIQERVNAQLEKTQQLEAINVASAKFVPSTFLNFLGKKNILEATLGDYVEKQVTVLFSDIRGFSALSEKMTPEENFQFVNDYNRRMGPIVQKHNGFVNQYLGDGIMAIFPENTEDTLNAAIEMQKELNRYNHIRINENEPPIRMGIGLHTGPLIMGIIGDEERMDAATISDTVNTASRIEGLTKHFGVNILLSEKCVDILPNKNKYNLRYLGLVQVKGKEETVKIYECFDGDDDNTIALKKETATDFEKGLDLYLTKNFGQAEIVFNNILLKNPLDKSTQSFLKKAVYFETKGTDSKWTGVERMSEK